VVLLLSNRPEFITVLLALQHLGAIAVPVGVREQRPGLAYIAQQCGARGIVFDEALADRVPLPDEAPALRGALARAISKRSRCPPDRCRPRTPTPRDRHRGHPLHLGHHRPPQGRDADAPEHRAFGAALRGLHALQRGDRSALAVPASHVTGLIAVIAAMWRVAGCVVVVPEFKADAFVRCWRPSA
jgi:long-chain acyl-CoA synthetase